jgi:hypothetical protein
MRRIRPLLAALFIPLAVLLVGVLLNAISPWRQPGPIIRLLVGPDYATSAAFDSRALRCPEQSGNGEMGDAMRLRARCSVEIAGQTLTVEVEHEGIVGRCRADYAGAELPCESVVAFYNSQLPGVVVRGDLGLPTSELRQLPGTNPLFYLSEQHWFSIQLALAVLITIAAILLGRGLQLGLPSASVAHVARAAGYSVGAVALCAGVWYALLFVLLISGLVD